MRTKYCFIIGILIVLSVLVSSVSAAEQTFNDVMKPIVSEYLTMTKNLAADKTTGVVDAAQKIETLSSSLTDKQYKGENAEAIRKIPAQLQKYAKAMQEAKDISAMRDSLNDLSKPFALWASITTPDGIYVAYCPMKPGSWLQEKTEINNPYYGSKMLRCGEIVSPKTTKQHHKH